MKTIKISEVLEKMDSDEMLSRNGLRDWLLEQQGKEDRDIEVELLRTCARWLVCETSGHTPNCTCGSCFALANAAKYVHPLAIIQQDRLNIIAARLLCNTGTMQKKGAGR